MNFELTSEQQAVRGMAREWALAEVAPVIHHFDETHEFPHEIVRSLGKTGLLGALVPEEYGGAGLDYVSYALAVEELNRVLAHELRTGQRDERDPALMAHLEATIADKIAIANPKWR